MSSTSRSDTALLLLRLSVGLSACLNAWLHLHAYGLSAINLHSGMTLLVWLLQFVCGGLMVIGLLMPWCGIPLLIMALAPLRWPPNPAPFLALLGLVAAMVGGPGRLAVGKN